jgi:hypothetical protein
VEDAIPFHIVGVGAITQDILILDHSAYGQGLVWPDKHGGWIDKIQRNTGGHRPASQLPLIPISPPNSQSRVDWPSWDEMGLGYIGFWGGG